jgi:hypothetical protein
VAAYFQTRDDSVGGAGEVGYAGYVLGFQACRLGLAEGNRERRGGEGRAGRRMGREVPPPRPPERFPRTCVMRIGCEETADRDTARRTSWPPPSPVRPSRIIALGSFILR